MQMLAAVASMNEATETKLFSHRNHGPCASFEWANMKFTLKLLDKNAVGTCYNLVVVSIRTVKASLTKGWDCCEQRRTAQDDINKVANLYPAVCGFTEQL